MNLRPDHDERDTRNRAGRHQSPGTVAVEVAANPDARSDYLTVKRAAEKAGGTDTAAYVEVKEPWFLDAYRRAGEWADSTGWKP